MEAPASYQKVLEEHAAGHPTSAEDQSHIFYGAAVESMKSGDCDKSVKLLNRACDLAGGILSTRGGEMRLWLALALDAARRRSEAVTLLTALESHPDGDVRTAAKELAFVFRAPELEWENSSHVSIDVDTFDDDVNVRRESEEGEFAPRAPETEAEGDASEEAPAPEPKRARTILACAGSRSREKLRERGIFPLKPVARPPRQVRRPAKPPAKPPRRVPRPIVRMIPLFRHDPRAMPPLEARCDALRLLQECGAGPRAADVETDYHRLYLRLYPRDGTRYVSFLRSMLARPEAPELLGLPPPPTPRDAERGADAARGDSTPDAAAPPPAAPPPSAAAVAASQPHWTPAEDEIPREFAGEFAAPPPPVPRAAPPLASTRDECPICMEELGDGVTSLECGHGLHVDCLRQYAASRWAECGLGARRSSRKRKLRCPTCRAETRERD